MNMSSFLIVRKEQSTVLVSEKNQLFMKQTDETQVRLTVGDSSYGIIHDKNKIYAYVEIKKVSNAYVLKNLDNHSYFYSDPVISHDRTSHFFSGGVQPPEWEMFNLKATATQHDDYISYFMDFLKDYKKDYKNNDEISVYWWRNNNYTNLGDELNPHIISYLTKKKVKRVSPIDSEMIGVGSILGWFPQRKEVYHVWGTGTMLPRGIPNAEHYDISLLRGPLTQSLFQKEQKIPYGDPGLLASLIWPKSKEKKYDWGIILHHHYEDKSWVEQLLKNTPNSILISAKHDDLTELMEMISSCKYIASTSLYGLIIADSYCIPNFWLWDSRIHSGNQWKFFDYFAGINRLVTNNLDPENIQSLSSINLKVAKFQHFNQIEKIQSKIIKSFPL